MIDENHPCFLMKYLRNKLVRELKGDEFLKLSQAESDRLLEIKITIDLDLGSDKRCVWGGATRFAWSMSNQSCL